MHAPTLAREAFAVRGAGWRDQLEAAGVALRPAAASRKDDVDLRKTWIVDQRTLRSHYGYPPRV